MNTDLPQRRRQPVIVRNGWVIFNGHTRLGFSLQGWVPRGTDRWAAIDSYQDNIPGMQFPDIIQSWILDIFRVQQADTVWIQRKEGKFYIHIDLLIDRTDRATVIGIVDSLCIQAGMPHVNRVQRNEELAAIMGEDEFFSEDDALAQWLGGRLQMAVQMVFAT